MLELFWTFCKIGALTFGGGYAMLPLLQREVVKARHWMSDAELEDRFAVSQSLPGLIAVNTAIFVGNKVRGSRGGIAAALGVAFPSLAVITVIAAFVSNFSDQPVVKNAFAGIRVCVLVLILDAILTLRKRAVVDVITGIVAAAVFVLSVLLSISPIFYVIAAGIAGILFMDRKAAAS